MSSTSTIAIIGGGWAGLSAATRLADSGAKVMLFERARGLGGRMGSFYDPRFDEWLDNGNHLFIGAYRSARDLLHIWGADEGLRFEPHLHLPWMSGDGKIYDFRLKAGRIGSALAVLGFKGLTVRDRWRAARGFGALQRAALNLPALEPTVADYLARFGLKTDGCNGLFEALTLAVMNAAPSIAGLYPLARAVKTGLLSGAADGGLGFPLKPFKQLYIDAAAAYLAAHNVDIHLNNPVESLKIDNHNRLVGIVSQGAAYTVDAVISTLQPVDLLTWLPARVRTDPFFNRLNKLKYSPIIAVHLVFDRPVIKERFGFFAGGHRLHWIFGRGEPEAGGWSKISTIFSYAFELYGRSMSDIVAGALDELRRRLPQERSFRVLHSRAVVNRRATVILEPGSDSLRLPVETPVKGLFLAGDWTATGLPATVESAARSGTIAAEAARSLVMRDERCQA
ncbi:MAG: FAD-binding protein [Calditrichaeota bacterium]|nr:FAD-binding protein [Calditrichota bacterium]